MKNSKQARHVDHGLAAQVRDSGSIHYAVSTDAVWYILDGKGCVVPGGGVLHAVPYPIVANTDTAIANFPPECEDAVVLGTAIRAAHFQLENLTLPTAPSVPSAPSFSYTNYSVSTVSAVTIDFITALSTDLTALGTYLDTNEDVELANQKISAIQEKIQQYVTQAQLTMQKNLADAQATNDNLKINAAENLNATVQQYSATIQRYSGQLTSYQADIANYQASQQKWEFLIKSLSNEYMLFLSKFGVAMPGAKA